MGNYYILGFKGVFNASESFHFLSNSNNGNTSKEEHELVRKADSSDRFYSSCKSLWMESQEKMFGFIILIALITYMLIHQEEFIKISLQLLGS